MKFTYKKSLNPNSVYNWEMAVQNLIYPEKRKDWNDMRRGVNANIIFLDHMELAVEVMKMLEDNQNFRTVKNYLENLRRQNQVKLEKPLKCVLYFSKKGPAFYKFYYNIKTGENQKVDAIETENLAFENKLKNRKRQENEKQ